MENIEQKRHNEGPVLNIHKRHYRKPLNKTFGTNMEKSVIFETIKKINNVSFLEIKLLADTLRVG